MTVIASTGPSTRPEDGIVRPRARVVTLTPSPAIDRLYVVDAVLPDEVNRARDVRWFLSGKGVNVARNLARVGGGALAVTPLAEREHHLLVEERLYRIVPTTRPTRVNTVVVSRSGSTMNVNEHARPMPADEWDGIVAATIAAVQERRAHWLVVAGSIPARADGTGGQDPRALVAGARAVGARVCLDSGGPTLRAWLEAGAAPDLVKPNAAELADAVGRPVTTVGEAVDAARELVDRGAVAVLASLGGSGAVHVTADGSLWGRPPRVEVVNTTGAGDAALAGFVADLDGEADVDTLAAAMRRAVAWGAHAVATFEAVPPNHAELPGVVVDEPPRDLPVEA
ncbi:hexose kinase [Pseudoclavibacter chungangensis]|uniref:Hexose kinase n=1 Tax=Pseudoclavibacter chungangensis TaxID=587635 RepID=A0A7J5BVY9_9MICO|nr:hexose kinase [Pseudoclavibacter chungangensis]KAB1658033.1 hexose kinase [Pseudoclavibacter chungangensis]NYJ65802.1 1-phosphofructokinase [Pseudoclavibacter chungangensis]